MTQNNRLLEFLKVHRRIDPMQAWSVLGIYRLSARILELRSSGNKITTTRSKVKNQFNEECFVATYVLEN